MTAPPSKHQNNEMADRAEPRPHGETAEEFVANAISQGELDAEINKLAAMPVALYESSRRTAADRLGGMRVTELDRIVKAKRAKVAKEQRDFLPHWKVDEWSTPVNGCTLLDELRKYFPRYVVLPKHADVVLALWTLHTWVFDCFDITPYLVLASPTRRCGKSLLMTMLYWLCCRAKKNDSMSKASIYRSVEAERPTLVLDEVSWVADHKDERQGILCGGFERLGYVEICEGEGADITSKRYSTYCPKAFGLIGKLVATLMDRSIEIAMQRKKNEKVRRLRRRDNEQHTELRRKCLRWANDNCKALVTIEPKLPEGLNDRAVDIWEPLLAIAERVGGDWPKLADEAALALSGGAAAAEERSVELLADINIAFNASGSDEVTTKALLAALCAAEERPWATYNKGKPISDRQVAKLLKQFPILSEDVYPPGERHAKGYKRARFLDAFERYLDPPNHASSQITGSQACERVNPDQRRTSRDFSIRVESNLHGCENSEKPASHAGLHAYTDKNPKTPRIGSFDHHNGDHENTHGGNGHDAAAAGDLTIPKDLDRRNEPPCDRCGLPGGAACDYDGLKVRLHSHCERPWVEAYEARRNRSVASREAC
jgi:putative DNA primase/helicase